ncbi:hypothetical protein B4O83_12230 [Chromohalobacter israelensis]|nr:hypothetical protein B4O83_12230 [Chromohalobacter salexigens]
MLAAVFRQMVPAGMVAGFPMTAPPTGWLKCNGAAVSRTTYADLFAAIGTRFGAGNGSTTFNVPDYRGEFPRWLDDGRGVDNNRGIAQHQGDQNREHAHGASASNDTHNHSGYTQYDGQHSHSGNTNQAGGHAHEIDLYANSGSSPNRTGAGQGGYLYKGSTNQAGAHAHSLNINSNGNHRHYFTTDNDTHGHTITINSAGGNEARPRNMPLLACIRY